MSSWAGAKRAEPVAPECLPPALPARSWLPAWRRRVWKLSAWFPSPWRCSPSIDGGSSSACGGAGGRPAMRACTPGRSNVLSSVSDMPARSSSSSSLARLDPLLASDAHTPSSPSSSSALLQPLLRTLPPSSLPTAAASPSPPPTSQPPAPTLAAAALRALAWPWRQRTYVSRRRRHALERRSR
eukprot:364849-Chlamydomonas_euryale.AAC.2